MTPFEMGYYRAMRCAGLIKTSSRYDEFLEAALAASRRGADEAAEAAVPAVRQASTVGGADVAKLREAMPAVQEATKTTDARALLRAVAPELSDEAAEEIADETMRRYMSVFGVEHA